jgi:hypothetical protein
LEIASMERMRCRVWIWFLTMNEAMTYKKGGTVTGAYLTR